MTKPTDGAPQFRRWLISKLAQTRWASTPGEAIESVAARLLVHPEALRLAQAELNRAQQEIGRQMQALGGRGPAPGVATSDLELAMPREMYAEISQYCQLRDITPGSLLRSAVQSVLLRRDNPRWLGRGWRFRGKRLVMRGYGEYRKQGSHWPYYFSTTVTEGARQALIQRARNSGTTPTGLVRGELLEVLEGRQTTLPIVSSLGQMYDDASRYVTSVVGR